MKRGIYLVANLKSQAMCENLVYSIRASGCTLPIRLIHFGGEKVTSPFLLKQVEFLVYDNFSPEAQRFITFLKSVLTDCPTGFLFRYLAWFSDWDEFIYSDNDIVALMNWEQLFDYLPGYDLVHADEEYTTKGAFNYCKPESIQTIFGNSALETAITAGHIVVKRKEGMIEDLYAAIEWFKSHPDIPQKHDQALLHIAALLGKWKTLNLCKPPYNWLSSWAGDYHNPLKLVQLLQAKNSKISHVHYSGGTPIGNRAIDEFSYSYCTDHERLKKIFFIGAGYWLGYYIIRRQILRAKRLIKKYRVKSSLILNS